MYEVDTTERVGDLIVQVVADTSGAVDSPREWDNLSHIYGSHRNYTIGDGEPPSDENAALERGGIPLLYRYLRLCKGAVAFTKLGMYDHSGVTFYAVPLDNSGVHPQDFGGWDSGITGYAYVTRDDLTKMGTDAADAERQMLGEIKEYAAWCEGDVWGYVVTKPCDHADEHGSDEGIAACPHSEHVDSCWGFIAGRDEALAEGKSIAEWHNTHAEVDGMIDTEPPCRVCGSSRDAHGTPWNHDHRYKAERYCVTCGKVARWYIDGDEMCSYHKGRAVATARDAGTEWNLRLTAIDRSR